VSRFSRRAPTKVAAFVTDHHAMVTKLPCHWCANSWTTVDATCCAVRAVDRCGSYSSAISANVIKPQFSCRDEGVLGSEPSHHVSSNSLGVVLFPVICRTMAPAEKSGMPASTSCGRG